MKSSPADESEASSQPRAIVAGHGDFPDGMVSAVEQISGRGGVFIALSNKGLSGQDIDTRLRDTARQFGVNVFFTDLPGGSATFAIRRMMHDMPDVVLVTGTNLATLLEFVFQDQSISPADAARRSAEKGRASLAAYGGE